MSEKHVAFVVEVPAIYTADLDDLREFQGDHTTESEWLLNCIGEPSVVRMRMEVCGEKDSSIADVWGDIREAKLVEPSRGYGDSPHLTDEQLEAHGSKLETPAEERISEAVDSLLDEATSLEDIREDLAWQLERIERRAAK